jgi:hypothetical protein
LDPNLGPRKAFPLTAELLALAKVLADWIEPTPAVPAIYLFGSRVEITGPIATSMSGCFSTNGKMFAMPRCGGGTSKTKRILRR